MPRRPLALMIGSVATLTAASLVSWLVPSVPALEPNVYLHDTYYSLQGWVAALVFMLAVCVGTMLLAVRYRAWSVWITRAAIAVAANAGFYGLLVTALWSAQSDRRYYAPPFALTDAFQTWVPAALRSTQMVTSVALLVTLLAIPLTLQAALRSFSDLSSSDRRRTSLAIFALGTTLCVAWGVWSVSSLLASRPSGGSFGSGHISYAFASTLVAIPPLVATFDLTRRLASDRLALLWRWSYVAAVASLAAAWVAGGEFTPVAVLINHVHMFFASGALAIWIAYPGDGSWNNAAS